MFHPHRHSSRLRCWDWPRSVAVFRRPDWCWKDCGRLARPATARVDAGCGHGLLVEVFGSLQSFALLCTSAALVRGPNTPSLLQCPPWVYEPQQHGSGEFPAIRQQRAGDGPLVTTDAIRPVWGRTAHYQLGTAPTLAASTKTARTSQLQQSSSRAIPGRWVHSEKRGANHESHASSETGGEISEFDTAQVV